MNGKNVKPTTPKPETCTEQSEPIQLIEAPFSIWLIASPEQAAAVNLREYGYDATVDMIGSCLDEAARAGSEERQAFWRATEAWLHKLAGQAVH